MPWFLPCSVYVTAAIQDGKGQFGCPWLHPDVPKVSSSQQHYLEMASLLASPLPTISTELGSLAAAARAPGHALIPQLTPTSI